VIKIDANEYIRKSNIEYDKDTLINWKKYKDLKLDEYLIPKSIPKKFVKTKDKERLIREFIEYYGFINSSCFFALSGTNRNIFESLCYGLNSKLMFVFMGVFFNRMSWNEFKTKINKRSSMVSNELCGIGDGNNTEFYTKKTFFETSIQVFCNGKRHIADKISENQFKLIEYVPSFGEEVRITYRSGEGMNFDITDRDWNSIVDTTYCNILSINDKISDRPIIFEEKNYVKKNIDRMSSFLSDEEISILYMHTVSNMDIEQIAYIIGKKKDSLIVKYKRIIDKVFCQQNILSLEYSNSRVICVLFLYYLEMDAKKISQTLDENYEKIKKIIQRKRDK